VANDIVPESESYKVMASTLRVLYTEMDMAEGHSVGVSQVLKLSLCRPIWTMIGFATTPFLFT